MPPCPPPTEHVAPPLDGVGMTAAFGRATSAPPRRGARLPASPPRRRSREAESQGRLRRSSRLTAALALACLVWSGCSGAEVPDGATSPTASSGAEVSTADIATAASTAGGSTTRPTLTSYQAIVVERSDDVLTVYAGSGDRDVTELYSADLDLPGWQNVTIEPYYPDLHPFTGDFHAVLFHGRPEGTDVHHIGILDLATGEARDLTEPRQGGGFTDSVLCEDSAGFVHGRRVPGPASTWIAAPGTRLLNRSERIAFHGRTGTLGTAASSCFADPLQVMALADPTSVTPVADEREVMAERVVASEDGRFLFGWIPDPEKAREDPSIHPHIYAFHSPDGATVHEADCRPGVTDDERSRYGLAVLGWVGPRTVALSVGASATASGFDWRTATLNDDGSTTCAGGIPQTDRDIADLDLSFDGTAILFTAEGASGPEQYRQPIDGSDPQPATYDEMPVGVGSGVDRDIYRVGPVG